AVAEGPLALAPPGGGWHVACPSAAGGLAAALAPWWRGRHAGGRGSAAGATDGAGHAQQVHMTAAHERHPTAATNGAGHGEASSSARFAACAFESISRFQRGLAATQGDRPVIGPAAAVPAGCDGPSTVGIAPALRWGGRFLVHGGH